MLFVCVSVFAVCFFMFHFCAILFILFVDVDFIVCLLICPLDSLFVCLFVGSRVLDLPLTGCRRFV